MHSIAYRGLSVATEGGYVHANSFCIYSGSIHSNGSRDQSDDPCRCGGAAQQWKHNRYTANRSSKVLESRRKYAIGLIPP